DERRRAGVVRRPRARPRETLRGLRLRPRRHNLPRGRAAARRRAPHPQAARAGEEGRFPLQQPDQRPRDVRREADQARAADAGGRDRQHRRHHDPVAPPEPPGRDRLPHRRGAALERPAGGRHKDLRGPRKNRHRHRLLRPGLRLPQAPDRLRRHLVPQARQARHHQPGPLLPVPRRPRRARLGGHRGRHRGVHGGEVRGQRGQARPDHARDHHGSRRAGRRGLRDDRRPALHRDPDGPRRRDALGRRPDRRDAVRRSGGGGRRRAGLRAGADRPPDPGRPPRRVRLGGRL
ncbi:MAG: Sugar-phosphatase AraL, partial [uncultured Rubrobacteraceae bacterium]